MRSKKFVIGYAVAIFLIVFLITFNSVCSITQFDVRYDVGSEKAETLSKNVQNRLDGYLRKSFLFFSEQDVYSAVEKEGGGYLEVVSVQKRFPNKITVQIKEVYEEYAFKTQEGYVVLDAEGNFIALKEDAGNNVNGSNVEIVGLNIAVDEQTGEIVADDPSVFSLILQLCTAANGKLGGIRDNIARIEYLPDENTGFNHLVFTMREGMKILIMNVADENGMPEACFSAALDKYLALGDADRLHGYIMPVLSEGNIQADYNPGESPL
ncbi:MAG TPA: hypothetical protein H9728_04960 [Candidatus Borkfalkia excrementavium]|uniref:POTRA domain-containing protein n=1 Tax=Candidatus Borkfalkia excrementavium TaxID=2838505 RepID=A0A9D2CGB8_9FIRM|nr:hypothetical protein [Candidatus Borkfalkia excrementavium]